MNIVYYLENEFNLSLAASSNWVQDFLFDCGKR